MQRRSRFTLFTVLGIFALAGIFVAAGALAAEKTPCSAVPRQPIKLHPDNPHYFLFRGKPAVLDTIAALARRFAKPGL